jgi:hypothetical protein
MNQTLETRLSDRIGRKTGELFARADFPGIGNYGQVAAHCDAWSSGGNS